MLKFVIFVISCVVVCNADVSPPIVCGYLPTKLYSCIGAPQVVKPELGRRCAGSVTQCERLTCIFNKAGWLSDGKLDKPKLLKYIDDFGKDHPAWQPTLEQAKMTCVTSDLPPQGVFLNCPAYDVTECLFATFVKNAQPSQWSSSPDCEQSRLFAGACPICPSDCFSPQIPIGSCNACLSLARTP